MKEDIKDLDTILAKSWKSILNLLPSIVFAIILFVIGLIIIRYVSKLISLFINQYSKNKLVTDFLVNVFSFVLTVLLLVVCLSILGWGNITNQILAGAGLTTFLIGFALKDIGENFLSGILMAFQRPFRIGDLIEVDKYRGRVTRMSLRETMIKTLDGRDVFIPNSIIVKTPLQNFTIDKYLRSEFIIGIDHSENIAEAMQIVEDVVNSFERAEDIPAPQILIDEFASNTVFLKVQFWYTTDDVRAPGVRLRSDIMLKTFNTLVEKGFNLPSDSMKVKLAGK